MLCLCACHHQVSQPPIHPYIRERIIAVESVNKIEIDTRSGGRTFELFFGDIIDLEGSIDLLVVSVNRQNYYPTANSVIGTLHRQLSIDVGQLARRPARDFRAALSCWVSKRLTGQPFKRLLCVEVNHSSDSEQTIRRVFSNVFATIAALEAKNYHIKTIAMPLLATGRGRHEPEMVMRAMLNHALQALEHSVKLRQINFVIRDETHALQLSDAMDSVLGRSRACMPKGAVIDQVRRKIADRIKTVKQLADTTQAQALTELQAAILSESSRPFAIGVASRKVIEFIARDLMAGAKYKDLNAALKQLADQPALGIAPWIAHYMEIVRVMGNSSAHMLKTSEREPALPTEADLELLLLCLLRVLDFWIERKRGAKSAATTAEPAEKTSSALISDVVSEPALLRDTTPLLLAPEHRLVEPSLDTANGD